MTDLDLIQQIEKELGVKLKQLPEIEWNSRSYTLNPSGQVTGLGFYDCKIENLERIISPLTALTNLTQSDLRGTQLSDLSPLTGLTNLTQLYLSDNPLSDLSPLTALTNLTQLYLSDNPLSDLSPLITLTNLTQLILINNQLNDISPLKALTNLTQLDLSDNLIKDISPLKALTNLTQLFLDNNLIKDISPLKELKNLNLLGLQKNPIEELPSWITDFNMQIAWDVDVWMVGDITLGANPLKIPPPEIVQQGKEAIRNYFEQLNVQDQDYLFEAKMLIVGEPGAGKTSLARKMPDPTCDLPREDETTRGIEVVPYYFPLQAEDFAAFPHPEKLANRKFRVNLWDFGGQEIYKATHRFFLSKRSLYALVADSRNEDTDFNYWLHIIEMFGGDSPLLIVLNEKHQRQRQLDIPAMQNRFTNIVAVIAVDFAEADPTRLSKLARAVKYFASQLPHIGSPVPAKWTVIREVIESDQRYTITLQDYMTICHDNGITRPQDALVLSQYLHDIGVFLHFQDDDLLQKTIFLKPTWATNAVYKILDHDLLNQNRGRFNRADAKIIWSEDEFMFVRDELLRLMQKFFLTYEIDHSGEYIVPERLPPAQPDYRWDEKDNLFLRCKYDFFMPKGIMSQLTVQMHRYIRNHDHVWRRGVVLERENTTAEIIETYDARTIKIRLAGQNRRDFMTLITEQLDGINGQYEKMKVEKLIPCNCSLCKTAAEPFFYQYQDLKRRLDRGRREVECGFSYDMVNVRNLIDEVINEALRSAGEREFMLKQINRQPEKVKREKVFVSYAHKDEAWLKRVQTHLSVLENLGISVNLWDDTQIKAGMKWRAEIEKALAAAKVAILLISTDFLASEFIRTDELPPLLKAAENEGATILPLILKPCLFDMHKSLAEFQAVNSPKTPLSRLPENEQDEILVALAARIAELVNEGK